MHADRAGRRRAGLSRASRSAPDRIASSGTPSTTASSSRPSTTTSAAGRRTTASILKIVPDDMMRGLELRKGTSTRRQRPRAGHRPSARSRTSTCRSIEAPGVDYQYLGAQPARSGRWRDVRVRQALAYAIDRQAIVEYLRRGLATPADTAAAAGVLGACAGRRLVSTRSGAGARAARRGRLSRSGRRRSRSRASA